MFDHHAYTYSELAVLKYCACCRKKDLRYKKYREHMEIMADRLDIVAIFSSEGFVNALSNVLMEPYQMKIISYFKKRQDDTSKRAYTIPTETAISQLRQRMAEPGVGHIESKINLFLLNLVKKEEETLEKQLQ